MANLGQVAGQAAALWGKLPLGRRAALIATVVVVLGGVLFLSTRSHDDGWVAIGGVLEPADALELGGALDGRGIEHRLRPDGALEVKADHLAAARIVAVAAGLPHTGNGFELFDHVSLGQSSFAEQVNYKRALQGEIARSITTMIEVDGARVHLALGRRSVLKEADERPSASVALRLRSGQTLTGEEVRGIKQLVAASVDGLGVDRVSVIDERGNLLAGEDKPGVADQAQIEQGTAQRVRAMLERAVGVGHVVVVATARMDQSQINQTEELYDKDKTALLSEARVVDGKQALPGASSIGGVAGVQGNLPGAPPATVSTTIADGSHLSETRNFSVSRVTRQTIGSGATIVRMDLAVLVDEKVGADGKSTPRTAEELVQLTALAKTAGGLDDARGDHLEVRSTRFVADPDEAGEQPSDVAAAAGLPILYIAIGGGAVLLALGAFVFVVARRRRRRQLATGSPERPLILPAPLADVERALSPLSGQPALPAGTSPHERMLEAVRGDVERAAQVLSSWLSEPTVESGEQAA